MIAARRAVLAAAALMLVVTGACYLDRPLRGDETDFGMMAREAIPRYGTPVLPPDAQRVILLDAETDQPITRYGMWHPPLYLYALAAVSALLPDGSWPLRAVGVACLLAALVLAWRIAGSAAPDLSREGRALAVAVPLLSPLVVESALLVDIDGTVLLAAVLLFIERWLAWKSHLTPARVAALAACFTLALAAKMTTPFVVIAAMLLHSVWSRGGLRQAIALVAIGAGGVAGLVVCYLVYCAVTGFPPGFMLDLYGLRAGRFLSKPIAGYALAVRWNLAWISPAISVLLALYTLERLRRLRRGERPEDADLLWIFTALSVAAYVGVAAYWGKYLAPAVMAGALGAGIWVARAWPALRLVRPAGFAGAIVLAGAAAAVLTSPRIRGDAAARTLDAGLHDPRNVAIAALVLMALAIALAARRLMAGPARAVTAGAAVLCAAALFSVIDQARVVTASAESGPLAAGRATGMRDVLTRLKALPADSRILAPKDIGYYYPGRSYPLDMPYRPDQLHALMHRDDVRVIVDSADYPIIPAGTTFPPGDAVRIGEFRVFVKR